MNETDGLRDLVDRAVEYLDEKKTKRIERKEEEEAERAITGQNRFDYWLTKQVDRGSGRGRDYIDSATTSDTTYYVDPRYYKVQCTESGGQRHCYVGDTEVFIGDPDMFDWYNALHRYEQAYGTPASYLTMTKHFDSIQTPNVGAKKELRVGSAIKQKVIPSTPLPILKKAKSMMIGEREFLKGEIEKFDLVSSGHETLSNVVKRFTDSVKATPLGILLAITEFQIELILEFLGTQVTDYNLLISQIDTQLSKEGMAQMVDNVPSAPPQYVPPQYVPAPTPQMPSMPQIFDTDTAPAQKPAAKINPLLIAGGLGLLLLLGKK